MNQIVSREKQASHRLKRIYIDSKYRASGASNQFTVSLPESLEMSHNHQFCLDDICIPRSWYVVNNNNNFIYLLWSDSGILRLRRAALTVGDYDGNTIATEVATALSTLGRGTFTVSFSNKTSRLTISNAATAFLIPTDAEIVNLGLVQAYNLVNNIADANFDVPQVYNLSKQGHKSINYCIGNFIKADSGTIKVLQPINLNNLDTLYIHASGMGSYNTVNLRGEPTIIKEIKVEGQPFSYIFDNCNHPTLDMLDCSHQTWSSLSFWITDKDGFLVDLNDRDLSFSIVLNDLTL